MRHDPIGGPVPGRHPVLLGAAELRADALTAAAGRAVALFAASGLQRGDAIAVASVRDATVLEVLVAALEAGLPLLVLDPLTGAAAAHQTLHAVGARAVVVDDDRADAWELEDEGAWAGRLWRIREAPRGGLLGRLLGRRKAAPPTTWPSVRDAHDPAPIGPEAPTDAPAVTLRTSGTSGRAHLPVLTHGNLDAQTRATLEGLELDRDSRFLVPSPASHIDGIASLYLAWRAGVAVVRPGPITVAGLPDILDGIYTHRVTHAMLVPSFLRLALRLGGDLRAAFDTPDFRHLISTAEPLPEPLWRDLEAATGCNVSNLYGMTEVGNVLFAGPDPSTRELGTVGHPLGCDARIVDEAGAVVVDGEVGELQLKGPTVCAGYLDEPELDAWFSTGDLARRRPSGAYELVGRKTGLLKVAGHRVVPEHVDAVLQGHQAVAEAVSVGVDDPTWGTRLVSAVVLSSPVDGDTLRRWAAERLADVEVPREVVVLESLPRGRTGKVARRQVAALLAQGDLAAATGEIGPQVVAIAERVFRAAPGTLSPSSASVSTEGWDSVAHLDLVVALESAFDMRFEPADIVGIRSLADAIDVVRRARA
jgi:acyl-coenzyme A synthetase/AMP-(fatty) acid ligase/acyl carrier protein